VEYKARVKLRTLEDIVIASDLAYCLHWAVTQACLENNMLPGNVDPYVIIERRRAFDWMLSLEDWDEVNLDT
jgi:hypothetical protein